MHAHTHVQLGLSCQRLLLKVQRWLRLTMQHVHSAENLGNECADHAAALGTFGLVSKQNIHVGRIIHLFPVRALLFAITLVMSWKSFVILELRGYLLPCAQSEDSVLSFAVFLCGLSCLCHRFLGRFSFIHLAQSYLVFLVNGFGVQWKG